ncbi:MAG: hypothetical protein ACI8RD_000524 [Bacillariaceae sp.]|jgi:hypothetical protein
MSLKIGCTTEKGACPCARLRIQITSLNLYQEIDRITTRLLVQQCTSIGCLHTTNDDDDE